MTETPAQMSDLIIKLYQDYSELRQMSDSGKIFIEKLFYAGSGTEDIM